MLTPRQKRCTKFVSCLLELYEFELHIQKGEDEYPGKLVFKLVDLQGGNLGNIEGDEFENLWQVISRMEVYHQDYIYEEIEGQYGEDGSERNEYAVYLESERVADCLRTITPKKISEDIAEEYFIHLDD